MRRRSVARSRSTSFAWRPVVGSSKRNSAPRAAAGRIPRNAASRRRCASPSGERRRRLAQAHVAQPGLAERLEAPHDLLLVAKEVGRVVDRHLENAVDVLAPQTDGEHAALEPPAVADVAPHRDVRQKLHVDRLPARAAAGLTAAAGRVEGEVAGGDAAGDGARGPRQGPFGSRPRPSCRWRGSSGPSGRVGSGRRGGGPRSPSRPSIRSCAPTSNCGAPLTRRA